MAFRVELSDRAQTDIAAIYDWLHSQQAGTAGERWFVALREAIGSLSELPLRCRVAPESRDSPVEVRQLPYGRKPHVYRILFAADDDPRWTVENRQFVDSAKPAISRGGRDQ